MILKQLIDRLMEHKLHVYERERSKKGFLVR